MKGKGATRKKIAVIGAGRSGLAAIKACKEENLDVVCFEKTDGFGGFWKYREDVIQGTASCMKSTVNIYSKEMDSFGDFPPPDDFPNYLHNTMVMEYLDMYAEHFDLYDHILYEHEVLKVEPYEDLQSAYKWKVKYRCLDYDKKVDREELFHGVMVCSGKRSHPRIPVMNGMDKYTGNSLHTKDIKSISDFDKKNVLVVGFGNSAVDAAVGISIVAKQVYVSTRSGGWVVPKIGHRGYPSDTIYLRRSVHWLSNFSKEKVRKYLESAVQSRVDHDIYGIRPKHDILSKHPVINDELPDKILTGRVIMKGDIESFQEKGVIFKGEKESYPVDAVVFATGYDPKITFLNDAIWKIGSEISLYKNLFPLSSHKPTLSVIGFVEPLGPPTPVVEAQCRLSAAIFNGKKLPPAEERLVDFQESRKNISVNFALNSSGLPTVNFIDYVDDLTSLLGARPDISSLFMKNPFLYWTCFTGPCLPYQYRLQGPHSWSEAGKAVIGHKERVKTPFRKKTAESDGSASDTICLSC